MDFLTQKCRYASWDENIRDGVEVETEVTNTGGFLEKRGRAGLCVSLPG